MRIVDLRCAPGTWIQYLAKTDGEDRAFVGYDMDEVSVAAGPRVKTFVDDVCEMTTESVRADLVALTGDDRVDAVLSDMAPKLSGIRDADQARSIALVEKALE